jgi:hypothetical protein
LLTEQLVESALPSESASFVRAYVSYARQRNCAPLAYHLGVALTTLASTCPPDYGGWYVDTQRSNLFVMAVGRSGDDYKSTAVNLGRNLLFCADPKRVIQNAETKEKMAEVLCATPIGMITYSELGIFLKNSEKGGYGEGLKTAFNELWECAPGAGAHIVKKSSNIPDNPRVSVAAACSLPYLEAHTEESDWHGGFMGRWTVLYARAQRMDPYPIFDDSAKQILVDNLATRCSIPTAGFCDGFEPEAYALWDTWYRAVKTRPFPKIVSGARDRATTMAFKAALIYAWDYVEAARVPGTWKMPISCLLPGILFAELHLKSLIGLSDIIADSPDARQRRKVITMFEDSDTGVLAHSEIVGKLKLKVKVIDEILRGLIIEKRVETSVIHGELAYGLRSRI